MDIYTYLITLAFFATLVTLVVAGGTNRDRLAELAINLIGKQSRRPHPKDESSEDEDSEE